MNTISSQKFEAFEKAFERGLKGKVETFEVWLRSRGLEPDFFLGNPHEWVLENLDLTVDREKELESVAEFIGLYKKEPNHLYHLSLIGVLGSGRTHLIHLAVRFLDRLKLDLPSKTVDASKFSHVDEEAEADEKQAFYDFLDEVKKKRYEVLLVDSCDQDKNIADSLRQISKVMKRGVLLTSWTHHHWNQLRDSVEESARVSKEIYAEPMSKEDTLQLVTNIVQKASKGKAKIHNEVAERIHSFSKGIPSVTISLLVITFSQAFVKGADSISAETVDDAAEAMGVKGVEEKVAKLAEHQLLIMKYILLEVDKRGIRPSRLVELLNKDKATVSYHLNSLSSERLLTVERSGRYSFYRVRPEIEPFVQLRIARESEYLA